MLPGRSVRLFGLGDLAALPLPEWRVHRLVCGLTLLWAAPGSFKTFLAISWAVAVASGRPWLGRAVKQGAVVFIVGEGALRAFYNRVQAAALVTGIPADQVAALPIYATEGPVDLARWSGTQAQELHAAALAVKAKAGPIGLLVVDTVSRCVPGKENDQEVMQAFVGTLDGLRRDLGCDVVAVHHANAEGDRERGSTVLPGAVDGNLHLVAGAPDADGSVPLSLYAVKLKEADSGPGRPPAARFVAHRVVVTSTTGEPLRDETGEQLTTCVLRAPAVGDMDAEDSTDAELVAAIPAEGASASKVAEVLRRRKASVSGSLKRLAREGAVRQEGKGSASKWFVIGSRGSGSGPVTSEPILTIGSLGSGSRDPDREPIRRKGNWNDPGAPTPLPLVPFQIDPAGTVEAVN